MPASLPDGIAIAGYLVVIPAICIFGIIGNVLTLVVLMKGQFQGVAFVYLKGLAVYDTLGLLFILPICAVRCPVCPVSADFAAAYVAHVYIPVGDVFLKASIVTTVILTVERCIVVCSTTLTMTRLRARRTSTALVVVVAIGVVTTLENLPTFWQVRVTDDGSVEITDYGRSRAFLVYGWFDAVCFQFLPMAVLFTFNIVLGTHLCSHQRRCRWPRANDENQLLDRRFQTEQTRIAFMLVGIVVLFLVTMVPSSVMQLVGYGLSLRTVVYVSLRLVSTTLTSLNFACNFLLYCTLNRRFWRTFKRIVVCCRGNQVHPETGDERPQADPVKANGKNPDSVKTLTNRSRDRPVNRQVSVSVLPNAETHVVPAQEEIVT